MKIIFSNLKGGGAKSTCCLLLASAIVRARGAGSVSIWDRDVIQQSSLEGMKFIEGVETYRPGRTKADIVLVDTPGSLESFETQDSLEKATPSDRIIVPCSASSMDLKSTAKACAFIDEFADKKVPRALLFCRMKKAAASSNPERLDGLAQSLGWRRISQTIPDRIMFEDLLFKVIRITPADRELLSKIVVEVVNL